MTVPAKGTRPAVSGEVFRDAMALLAAPLAIVTTRDAEGRRWGFTASSVTSVSLDPPLLLVGLSHTSSCYGAFTDSPEFAVNVLGERHRDLARRFSTPGVDRFAGQDFASFGGQGPPYLPDAHVALRCAVADRIRTGDHDLLIGAPTGVHARAARRPLLWYRRGFRTPEHGFP